MTCSASEHFASRDSCPVIEAVDSTPTNSAALSPAPPPVAPTIEVWRHHSSHQHLHRSLAGLSPSLGHSRRHPVRLADSKELGGFKLRHRRNPTQCAGHHLVTLVRAASHEHDLR